MIFSPPSAYLFRENSFIWYTPADFEETKIYVMRTRRKKLLNVTLIAHIRNRYDGVGVTRVREIIARLGLKNGYKDISYLSQRGTALLEEMLGGYRKKFVKSEFTRKQAIINLQKAKTRRGRRHKSSLPVRGQRTHTNARVRKRYKIY